MTYDPVDYKQRNVIERGFCRLKQWRGLATRYDKLAIVYRAAVVLDAVIAWLQHSQDTPRVCLLMICGCGCESGERVAVRVVVG